MSTTPIFRGCESKDSRSACRFLPGELPIQWRVDIIGGNFSTLVDRNMPNLALFLPRGVLLVFPGSELNDRPIPDRYEHITGLVLLLVPAPPYLIGLTAS